MKTVELDRFLLEEPNLVADPKIRELFREGPCTAANPQAKEFQPCELEFVETSDKHYHLCSGTLQRFTYRETDRPADGRATLPYFGPLYSRQENLVYIGQMDGGQKNGHGFLVFLTDGSVFEGLFANDQIGNRGRLLFDNGDWYEGEISEGKMHGHGVYFNVTLGSKYEGMFQEEAPHGYGREEWQDGTLYEGDFVMGEKEGKGSFRTKEGNVYQGDFKNGVFDGYGVLVTANNTKYTGKWKQGDLQSPADIEYSDNRKYTGEINKELKPHGQGKILSATKEHVGTFKSGCLEGTVMTISSDGSTRKSLYENGTFIKWLDEANTHSQTNMNPSSKNINPDTAFTEHPSTSKNLYREPKSKPPSVTSLAPKSTSMANPTTINQVMPLGQHNQHPADSTLDKIVPNQQTEQPKKSKWCC